MSDESPEWQQPWARASKLESSGVLEPIAKYALANAMRFSIHHWLQYGLSKGGGDKKHAMHVATDVYFLLWVVAASWAAGCSFGFSICGSPSRWFTLAVVYRIVEALGRELWVVLFRGYVHSTPARPIIANFVNYATVVGLFGYLYGGTSTGYKEAYSIGFTFSPLDPASAGWMEVTQAAYCFVFTLLILGAFIARVQLLLPVAAKKAAVESDASKQLNALREAASWLETRIRELVTELAQEKAKPPAAPAANKTESARTNEAVTGGDAKA